MVEEVLVRQRVIDDLKTNWRIFSSVYLVVTAMAFVAVVQEAGFTFMILLTIPLILGAGLVGGAIALISRALVARAWNG